MRRPDFFKRIEEIRERYHGKTKQHSPLIERYIARCPVCNGVVGTAEVSDTDHAGFVAGWTEQGLIVNRQKNKANDPMPVWCSRQCDQTT